MPGQKVDPMKRMEAKYIIQSLSVKALHSAMGSRGTPARQQAATWSSLRNMKGSHSIRRC